MSEAVVKIVEGNRPTLKFACKERLPDGSKAVMDLTGATITLFVKDTPGESDGSAETAAGSVVGTPTDGNCEVAITAAMSSTPGLFFHRLDVVKAGRSVTVQYGDWIVINA